MDRDKIAPAFVPREIPDSDMWFDPLAPVPEATEPPAVSQKTNDISVAAAPTDTAQVTTPPAEAVAAEPVPEEAAVKQQELFAAPPVPQSIAIPLPTNVPAFGSVPQPQVTPRGRQL